MTSSANLSFDYISESQAQKHVTMNEALSKLDVLVQPRVIDKDLSSPPGSPSEGNTYIVASPASGLWVGQENNLASYLNGAWVFYTPVIGWNVYVQDETTPYGFNGTAWGIDSINESTLSNGSLLKLGVNTTATDTARLSVKSDSVVLSHDDVTPGSGDIDVVINKDGATDAASITLQTGFSGRAIFGLLDNDNFTMRVSSNGSSFNDAYVVSAATGVVNFSSNPTTGGNSLWHAGNDGSGSGLDADLLDGNHAAAFAQLTGATFTGGITATGFTGPGGGLTGVDADNLGGQSAASYALLSGATFSGAVTAASFSGDGASLTGVDAETLDGVDSSAFAQLSGATFTGGITATGFTGPGGGLTGVNAANLGGQSAASYALLSGATFSGAVSAASFSGDGSALTNIDADTVGGTSSSSFALLSGATFTGGLVQQMSAPSLSLETTAVSGVQSYFKMEGARTSTSAIIAQIDYYNNGTGVEGTSAQWLIGGDGDVNLSVGTLQVSGGEVWHANNDGSGSGLDADLLDGNHASAFAQLTGATFTGGITATGFTGNGGGLTGVDAANLGGQGAASYALLSGATFSGAVSAATLSGNGAGVTNISLDNIVGGSGIIVASDTVANANFAALYVDHNISGSDSLTTDRTHRGILIDMDSSATGGDATDEHRIHGVSVDIAVSGDSDLVYGGYFRTRSYHSSGTMSTMKGVYGLATADNTAGTTTTVYGLHGIAQADGVGGAVSTLYGTVSQADMSSNTDMVVGNAVGSRNEVEIDSGTISNAYAVQAVIDRNGGTITNSYLFHGDYQGTIPGNAWGLYINEDVPNLLAGSLQMSGDGGEISFGRDGETVGGPNGLKFYSSAGASAAHLYYRTGTNLLRIEDGSQSAFIEFPNAVSTGVDSYADWHFNSKNVTGVSRIGIGGATPDATNTFAFYGTNMLLNSGGSIDTTFNKNASGNDATFSFKTGFSSKAILGLQGNDDFTLKVGSSFHTALVAEESTGVISFPSGAKTRRIIDVAGRWYCYTDNRWVTASASYGIATENFNANDGTGTEPNDSWGDYYIFAREGTVLSELVMAIRPNSSEVTGFNIRVQAIYATSTQFENTTWNSNGETTFHDILSENSVSFSGTNWFRYNPSISTYTMPKDGFITIKMQPIGTITTTRYMYLTGEMVLTTPD